MLFVKVFETYYADCDLTKVTPRRMLGDAYIFTENDLSTLIKQHGDRINLITKDEELKVGFYNESTEVTVLSVFKGSWGL